MDRRSIESVRLYDDAKARCDSIVRDVLNIIRVNLTTDLFRYDACLVRDGCFFAAFVLADGSGSQEDVDVCLTALSQMRWIFSKSEERMHTVQMVWQARVQQGRAGARTQSGSPGAGAGASFFAGWVVEQAGPSSTSSTWRAATQSKVPPCRPHLPRRGRHALHLQLPRPLLRAHELHHRQHTGKPFFVYAGPDGCDAEVRAREMPCVVERSQGPWRE